MSQRPSLLRRIASALMAYAAEILPRARSSWAEAMKHELDQVEGDRAAVTWAVGCLLASCVERSRVLDVMHTWYVRGLLTLLIVVEVVHMLFAPVLYTAYCLQYLRVAEFLGGFTPGDDYRRFIPLMNAAPWLNWLWVAAGLLFLLSAWQFLRNSQAAFPLFAAAWVLGTAGDLLVQSLPAYREAFSFPEPLFTRDYLIPAAAALAPVLIAAALWAHGRCSLAESAS